MKYLILNGNPDHTNLSFESYVNAYAAALEVENHKTKTHMLRDLNIKYCTGCWTCWWKTPGKCVFNDAEEIYTDILSSDFLVFASPIIYGFPSALTKKMQDRIIPLLHPYIEIIHGECHHKKRYAKYPELVFLLQKETDTDANDIEIIDNIHQRLAINFRTKISEINYFE